MTPLYENYESPPFTKSLIRLWGRSSSIKYRVTFVFESFMERLEKSKDSRRTYQQRGGAINFYNLSHIYTHTSSSRTHTRTPPATILAGKTLGQFPVKHGTQKDQKEMTSYAHQGPPQHFNMAALLPPSSTHGMELNDIRSTLCNQMSSIERELSKRGELASQYSLPCLQSLFKPHNVSKLY